MEFTKVFNSFVTKYGFDINRTFDDFLQYIIWAHTIPEYGKKIEEWSYTPEQSKEFFDLYQTLVLEAQREINRHGWCDVFGRVYEELVQGKFIRTVAGQFFTPESICELMTDTIAPKEKRITGKLISDPTCGSGRNLLAFNSRHIGNYFVAEDISYTCVLMTTCNFILHGIDGEVIWHDTLNPTKEPWGVFRTNEQLNIVGAKYNGIPHVREYPYEDTRLKHITDYQAKIYRISNKLSDNIKRHEETLQAVRQSNLPAEEREQQERQITRQISRIKKVTEKYRN